MKKLLPLSMMCILLASGCRQDPVTPPADPCDNDVEIVYTPDTGNDPVQHMQANGYAICGTDGPEKLVLCEELAIEEYGINFPNGDTLRIYDGRNIGKGLEVIGYTCE